MQAIGIPEAPPLFAAGSFVFTGEDIHPCFVRRRYEV
jgi:hypothetical protein